MIEGVYAIGPAGLVIAGESCQSVCSLLHGKSNTFTPSSDDKAFLRSASGTPPPLVIRMYGIGLTSNIRC